MTIKAENIIVKKVKQFSQYTIYTSFFMVVTILAFILDYNIEAFIVPIWFIIALQVLVLPMVMYIMNTDNEDMTMVKAFTPIVVITIFTILMGMHKDSQDLKIKVDTISKEHPTIMALNGNYPNELEDREIKDYKLLVMDEEYYIEWKNKKYPLNIFKIEQYREVK